MINSHRSLADHLDSAIADLIREATTNGHVKAMGHDPDKSDRCLAKERSRVAHLLDEVRRLGAGEQSDDIANVCGDKAENGNRVFRYVRDGASTTHATLVDMESNPAPVRALQGGDATAAPKTQGVAAAIPVEDRIRWQAGGTGVQRAAVMVDGRSWYRDDHPLLQTRGAASTEQCEARPIQGAHQ